MNTQNPFSENPYRAPLDGIPTNNTNGSQRKWTLFWILFSLEGRIPRRVYWTATFSTFFVYCIIGGFCISLASPADSSPTDSMDALTATIRFVSYFPLMWIIYTIQAKRWHDCGKSGWWVFINFIPLIGPIWTLAEAGFQRGDIGPNQYGPDPT